MTSKEHKLIKALTPAKSEGSEELIIPNHSGDHQAGRMRRTPENDTDIANKKYVDDKISNDAYNATTWNADFTGGASRNAIRDKIESITSAFASTIFQDTTGNLYIHIPSITHIKSSTSDAYGEAFPTAADKYVQFVFRVPDAFDSKKMRFSFIWMPQNADTGTVRWLTTLVWGGAGEAYNSDGDASVVTEDDGDGTAFNYQLTTTNTTTNTVSTNDFVNIKIWRNGVHANDTYTGWAGLMFMVIEHIIP
jgi:hypothetical protein